LTKLANYNIIYRNKDCDKERVRNAPEKRDLPSVAESGGMRVFSEVHPLVGVKKRDSKLSA